MWIYVKQLYSVTITELFFKTGKHIISTKMNKAYSLFHVSSTYNPAKYFCGIYSIIPELYSLPAQNDYLHR